MVEWSGGSFVQSGEPNFLNTLWNSTPKEGSSSLCLEVKFEDAHFWKDFKSTYEVRRQKFNPCSFSSAVSFLNWFSFSLSQPVSKFSLGCSQLLPLNSHGTLPLVSLFQMFILPKLFPFSFLIPPPHLCLPFSFQIGNRHPHSPSLTPFLISSPSSAQNPAPLFPSSLFP